MHAMVALMTRKPTTVPPPDADAVAKREIESLREARAAETETVLTVREFVAQLPDGRTMSQMAKRSGVPFTSLSTHVRHSAVPLSVKNAKKLQKWSKKQTWIKARIGAAKTLGVDDE